MNKAKAARKGREKGKRGESAVAKLFSKWYGKKDSFLRSRTSGAFFKNVEPGDITCPPKFPLILEVKNAEGWSFKSLLEDTENSTLLKYYDQCYSDYENYKKTKNKKSIRKIPCVIFTKNYHPWYMLYDAELFDLTGFFRPNKKLQFSLNGKTFFIQKLDDFFLDNRLTAFELGLKFEG